MERSDSDDLISAILNLLFPSLTILVILNYRFYTVIKYNM